MEPMNVATKLVADLEAAWNRADGAAYGDAFTDDAEFIDIRGVIHRGKRAIAGGHQGIFDTIYKGSRLRHRVVDARSLTPDVIVAHGAATLDTSNGMFEGRYVVNTLVLARAGDGWRIAAFHNALA